MRVFWTLPTAGLLVATGPVRAQSESTWSEIRGNVIGDRTPQDGDRILTLTAPKRAEDAAIVPIDIHVALSGERLGPPIHETPWGPRRARYRQVLLLSRRGDRRPSHVPHRARSSRSSSHRPAHPELRVEECVD